MGYPRYVKKNLQKGGRPFQPTSSLKSKSGRVLRSDEADLFRTGQPRTPKPRTQRPPRLAAADAHERPGEGGVKRNLNHPYSACFTAVEIALIESTLSNRTEIHQPPSPWLFPTFTKSGSRVTNHSRMKPDWKSALSRSSREPTAPAKVA